MSDNAYTPPASTVSDQIGSVSGAVTAGILEQLRRSRIWVLIIAITLLVLALLMVLGGVAMIAGTAFMGGSAEMQAMGGPALLKGMGVVYILMSLLFYLIPSILLFRYAGAISKAVNTADAYEAEQALKRQAGFWKYVGIFTLIILILTVVFIIVSIAAPALFMGGMGGIPATP